MGTGKLPFTGSISFALREGNSLMWSEFICDFRNVFFQDDKGRAVTVTFGHYITILDDFLLPIVRHNNAHLHSYVHLLPCDYFLRRYLKHQVYENRPHSIDKFLKSTRNMIPLGMLDSHKAYAETCLLAEQ